MMSNQKGRPIAIEKCQPRATRPQVPFQGPPHGLVFHPDYGVNGTTNPQTQQIHHAHIIRVHLAGCCKGQAQQHEINLGRAPRAYREGCRNEDQIKTEAQT